MKTFEYKKIVKKPKIQKVVKKIPKRPKKYILTKQKQVEELKAKLTPENDSLSLHNNLVSDEVSSSVQSEEIINDKQFQAFLKTFKKEHKKFADEYLLSLKIASSYEKAYPKATRSTAEVNGSRLLQHEDVKKYLAYMQEKRLQRFNISKNGILLQLAETIQLGIKQATKEKKPNIVTVKAMELLTRITGDINPQNSSNNSGSDLVIVKCYVVPSINNTISLPVATSELAIAAVESALKTNK